MWKQEPRELSSIKLTWMCLIKEQTAARQSLAGVESCQVFDLQALREGPHLDPEKEGGLL